MHFHKKLSQFLAILSITQVVLLSMASFSPGLHSILFHSAPHHHFSAKTDTAGCGHHHENQSDKPKSHDGSCPVSLFSHGVAEPYSFFINRPCFLVLGYYTGKAQDELYLRQKYNAQRPRAPPVC